MCPRLHECHPFPLSFKEKISCSEGSSVLPQGVAVGSAVIVTVGIVLEGCDDVDVGYDWQPDEAVFAMVEASASMVNGACLTFIVSPGMAMVKVDPTP